MNTLARVRYSLESDLYEGILVQKNYAGDITHRGEVVYKPFDLGSLYAPTFALNRTQAQQLFDDLWQEGFRPKGEWGESAQKAMEAHLTDLRKITMHSLGIK